MCYGVDLSVEPSIEEINEAGINLEYLVDAYTNIEMEDKTKFFRSFIELLSGRDYVRKMIHEGKSAAEIEAVWEDDVKHFIEYRRPYLLYPDNL